MTVTVTPPSTVDTLADFVRRLGDVPLERIRFHPLPGTATERDVIDVHAREKRLCELVDGTLVEKGMGYRESALALAIAAALREFVIPRNLGVVSGESGMMRLFAGLVRIPDVAYASWDRFADRRIPREPVPALVPDLAVEVLSESNTPREMQRKRGEYFRAGVSLVWIVDPDARTVVVYAAPEQPQTLTEADILDGGHVLPGFALSLREIFAELDRTGA